MLPSGGCMLNKHDACGVRLEKRRVAEEELDVVMVGVDLLLAGKRNHAMQCLLVLACSAPIKAS